MHAYSQDLRDRVLRAIERGERPTAIAERLEVSRVWVYQVRQRYRSCGERSSLPMGGHRISRLAGKEAKIRRWIEADPGMTLAEICARLAKSKVEIKAPALWHQLDKWGLTFKKNAARHRARAQRRTAGAPGVEQKPARLRSVEAGFPR
jgi:transposase